MRIQERASHERLSRILGSLNSSESWMKQEDEMVTRLLLKKK